MNEMIILKLIKTYCLWHGCQIWPTETVDMHELDVIWNNGFRYIFNCCWRDSVKPLQYFVNLCLFDRGKTLIFFSKLQRRPTDNIVL